MKKLLTIITLLIVVNVFSQDTLGVIHIDDTMFIYRKVPLTEGRVNIVTDTVIIFKPIANLSGCKELQKKGYFIGCFEDSAQTEKIEIDTILSAKQFATLLDTMQKLQSLRFKQNAYWIETGKEVNRECLINGKRLPYSVCGTGNLEEIKRSYRSFYYMGSGHIYFINGYKNVAVKLTHFFY